MNNLPRISEKSPEGQKEEVKFDVMKQQFTIPSDVGHFERQGEVRFHPTETEKAGGIHLAAEKAREAQQRLEENLKSGHKKDEPVLKKEDSYEKREKDRMAREKAKRDSHNINEAINKQIHQKCYDAHKETAASMRNDIHAGFVNHIH